MFRKLLMVGGFAVAMVFSAGVAHADSITVGSVQFTATVTGTNVTLTVQCLNTAVCGDWYVGDVTVKGFNFTGTPTLGTAPSGYLVMNGGQNNSDVGSGGGCNGTEGGKAVCWDAPSTLGTQLGGSVHTFTATITNGTYDGSLAVMATFYSDTGGNDKVFAVSNDLTPGTPPTSAPEPGTLLLLGIGSGLLGLALVKRHASSTT